MRNPRKTWRMPVEPPDSTDDVRVVRSRPDGRLIIANGEQHIVVNDFSAVQLVGMLMLMLEMPIPKTLGKRIMLGWGTREGDPPAAPSFTLTITGSEP